MGFQWEWLRGGFEAPAEARSFAALRIELDGSVLTRLYDRIAEGERDRVNIALYPLALAMAENWWTLLYEPRKSEGSASSPAGRHNLDSYMNGFVFPPLALWSGGDDAIVFEHPHLPVEHSTLEFLPPAEPATTVPRSEVEENLFALINSVAARVPEREDEGNLHDAWGRVLESIQNESELQYCRAAGRLGIDPYDPEADDISGLAGRLSDNLFANVCEAVTATELAPAIEWTRENVHRMSRFPDLDIAGFGRMSERNVREKAWLHGYRAARQVRQTLGIDDLSPRRVVDSIFGAAVRADAESIGGTHPFALEAITGREDGSMRIAVPAASARLRRFRLCRAAYLAWLTADGDSSAVTTATTLDQQASRAFAAEILAPAELLREVAADDGLNPEKIDGLAEENVCNEQTIIWQAYNHGIQLRGVDLPAAYGR